MEEGFSDRDKCIFRTSDDGVHSPLGRYPLEKVADSFDNYICYIRRSFHVDKKANEFLEQNWPDLTNEGTVGPTFIPEVDADASFEVVGFDPVEDTDGISDEHSMLIQTIGCEQAEREALLKLKSFLEARNEKVVVIHSWKPLSSTQNRRTPDFLIISEKHKMIVNLEVSPTAFAHTGASIAKKQLDHLEVLDTILPCLNRWAFVKSAFFPLARAEICCTNCTQFVLTSDSDMDSWWSSCVESEMVNHTEKTKSVFKTLYFIWSIICWFLFFPLEKLLLASKADQHNEFISIVATLASLNHVPCQDALVAKAENRIFSTMTQSHRRLIRDLKLFQQNPPFGISASPVDDNLMIWLANICGPLNSPFKGGTFKLIMKFSHQYPYHPPKVRFTTKIFHPNINEKGEVCLEKLTKKWTPAYNVTTILTLIQTLLSEPDLAEIADPNPMHPFIPFCNPMAVRLFQSDRRLYEKEVAAHVEQSWSKA